MNNSDLDLSETASVDELLKDCKNNNRTVWISHQFGNIDIIFFQDGTLSRHIAREAIHCFIDGYFIATILLAFSLIERSIAGRLLAVGETKIREERSLEKLLKLACSKKWISKQEFREINMSCSEYRNSIAHIRTPSESTRHEVRAFNTGGELCDVIEGDARFMLSVAFKILGKTSI